MSLPAVRAFVVSQLEPPLTWRYGPELRLWPFLSSGVAAIIASFIFLVLTNHNSQTCQDTLRYDYWQDEATTGCRLLEDALGDWTQLLQQWPPQIAGTDVFFAPKAVALPQPPELRPYAPQNCSNTVPDGFLFLVNISAITADAWYVTAIARVLFEPPIIVVIRGFVPEQYSRFMANGVISVNVSNFNGNLSSMRPVITGSSFANPQVAARVLLLYGRLVPAQIFIMLSSACANYCLGQHLMECRTCSKDSWVTVGWIIVLGCVQAVTLIYSIVRCCLHSHNRRHQMKPRDQSNAEPMLSEDQSLQWSHNAPWEQQPL